jgi:O-antigen/teichoic acid export membrane protein
MTYPTHRNSAALLPHDVEPAPGIPDPSCRTIAATPGAGYGRKLDTILAVLDQAIVSGGNFATTVIVARSVGMNGLGIYSLAITIAILLSAIQESLIVLPYTVYANRLTGLPRAHCAGSALVQQLVLAFLAMVILVSIAALLAVTWRTPLTVQIAILAICAPFVLLREFGRRVLFADLRVIAVLILDLVVTSLLLIGLVILSREESLTAITALACLGGASAVGGLGWLFAVRQHLAFSRESVLAEAKRNGSVGGWACLSRITNVAESYLVHWLLAFMLGTVATGQLAACVTVVNLSNPFLLGAGAVLAPYAARAYANGGRSELSMLMSRANRWLIPPTVAFVAVMFVFGRQLLEIIYDDAFVALGKLVAFLSLSVLASTFGMAADNALRAMEKSRLNFFASFCGLATSTMIAFAAIPLLGALGAAISLALGGSVAAVFRVRAARRLLLEGAR